MIFGDPYIDVKNNLQELWAQNEELARDCIYEIGFITLMYEDNFRFLCEKDRFIVLELSLQCIDIVRVHYDYVKENFKELFFVFVIMRPNYPRNVQYLNSLKQCLTPS